MDFLRAKHDDERGGRPYTKVRRRAGGWLEEKLPIGRDIRDVIFLLPDLFVLVIRLIADGRINRGLRLKLIGVTAYVISPIDILPDLLIPFGLTDDAFAMAIVLSHVVAMMSGAGEDILREHWEGDGDVIVRIRDVASKVDGILNMKFTNAIRKLFF